MQENEQFKSKKQERKWSKKLKDFYGEEQYPKVSKNYNKRNKRIKKVAFNNEIDYNNSEDNK